MARSSDDEQAFLAQILAAPAEDAPRLIWADWLEERGDPRGDFIRAQCAAARLPPWDIRRKELELRATQLWRVHYPAWIAKLPKLQGAKWLTFERGMPAGLEITDWNKLTVEDLDLASSVGAISTLQERWYARHDPRRALRMDNGLVERIARLESLQDLFDENGVLIDHLPGESLARLRQFATSVPNPGLLNVGYLAYDQGRYEPLTRCSLETLAIYRFRYEGNLPLGGLKQLRRLAVREGILSYAELQGLAANQSFSSLESLDLTGTRVGENGLHVLATAEVMQSLRSLRLARTGNVMIRDRLREHLPELVELDLSSVNAGDAGLYAVLDSPGLRKLRSLSLASNGITADAIEELARAPLLARLQALDLSNNPVGDRGAAELAGSEHAAGLKFLKLQATRITDRGAEAVAHSPHLRGLVSLSLHGNALSNSAVETLRERFDFELIHNFERIPRW